ncbi:MULTISPECIES: LCP family protein [Bacillus]|uniref:LCP family protein n=1 Tax=Bacillus TaxID=1386 RepID=UPI00039F0D80|nr:MULTISPECIES: LCP family protein [Bacillus]KUL17946.1 LytR family transcriptional regulator [Bacillus licheniformis LMG 6934]MDE1383122.1 LCP family protein [Bacillus paralicheniformis]MSN98781.1 LytR family transcriptional regulator [Bacillus paralicheniformis]MSO02789.1 LytR family transcriptional regulator [Bacillus paralicheniformis]MSO06782.1 LytR family transcriptional regulator [Bacillus paralicheniformis]
MLRSQRTKKKRLRKWVKYSLFFIALILTVTAAAGGYAYYKVANASKDAQVTLSRGEQSVKRIKEFNPKKDNFSILLMGIDARPGQSMDKERSDAMVLATFNRKDKSVKLLSIPRDSYVNIPGHGFDKITHAHSLGGRDLSTETVENLLDIPVDYVMEANFSAFKEVVDELGGVPITIKEDYIVRQIKKDTKGKVNLQTGEQTLNGEEALAYVRTRKADTDLKRGDRQMEVIKSIINKSKSLTSIPAYDDILDTVGKNVSMNLSLNDAIGLIPFMTSIQTIDTLQLKGSDYQPGKVYYFQLDQENLNEIKQELKQQLDV